MISLVGIYLSLLAQLQLKALHYGIPIDSFHYAPTELHVSCCDFTYWKVIQLFPSVAQLVSSVINTICLWVC